MSRDSRKTERRRLKRKQKQLKIRKAKLRTALQHIAAEGGTLECWITHDWKEQGLASIQVLAHTAGGRWASASFLVDLWCVGLKDGFGRSEVSGNFRQAGLEPWIKRTGAIKLDADKARQLVAGGVRFSRQNGFRLPAHWEKWTSIFGRDFAAGTAHADLSNFGIDDGLRYVGTLEFLRERLIACTPQEFLGRPDVGWVSDPSIVDEFEMLDEDEEDDDADEDLMTGEDKESLEAMTMMLDRSAAVLAARAGKWCAGKGRTPHVELIEGARMMLATLVPLAAAVEDAPKSWIDIRQQAVKSLGALLGQLPSQERDSIFAAVTQIHDYMSDASGAWEDLMSQRTQISVDEENEEIGR